MRRNGDRRAHRRALLHCSTAVVLGALTVAPVAVARAQTCAGSLSLGDRRLLAGAFAEQWDDRSTLLGGLGLARGAVFGMLSGGIVSRAGLRPAAPMVAVVAGLERALGSGVRACPRVSAAAGFGPRDIEGSDVDARSIDLELGMEAGRAFLRDRRIQIVPFVGAGLRRSLLELSSGAGESIRRSDVYGTIDAGSGIVVARRLAIIPRVTRTLGALDDDASISLRVAVGL